MHGKRQWGGTGINALGKTTAKIAETGEDDKHMGRWAWMRLRGKKDTVVVAVYNPVKNNTGPQSVHMQQRAALLETGDTNEPLEVLCLSLIHI